MRHLSSRHGGKRYQSSMHGVYVSFLKSRINIPFVIQGQCQGIICLFNTRQAPESLLEGQRVVSERRLRRLCRRSEKPHFTFMSRRRPINFMSSPSPVNVTPSDSGEGGTKAAATPTKTSRPSPDNPTCAGLLLTKHRSKVARALHTRFSETTVARVIRHCRRLLSCGGVRSGWGGGGGAQDWVRGSVCRRRCRQVRGAAISHSSPNAGLEDARPAGWARIVAVALSGA